jgi:hypothetical protein
MWGVKRNDFDGNIDYDSIATGLQLQYGDVLAGPEAKPDFWSSLLERVHVLAPPTTYTWGMGRMWHRDANGNVWYLSVPLLPKVAYSEDYVKLPDVSVRLEPAQVDAKPGQELTFTATLKLKKAPVISVNGRVSAPKKWFVRANAGHNVNGQSYPVTLEPLDGSPEFSQGYNIAFFEEGVEYRYKLTVRAQNASSVLGVLAKPFLYKDADMSDNYAESKVNVDLPDFYASISPHKVEADPGQPLAFDTTFGLKAEEGPWKALLRAFHEVDGKEHPAELKIGGAVIPPDQPIEFSPGEEKKGTVAVTSQESDSRVIVKINPVDVSEDADWSDNRDEALITIREQCTDISVSAYPSEIAVENGGAVTIYAIVKRAKDGPEREVPVKVALKSPSGTKTWDVTLRRGREEILEASYKLTGDKGDVKFTAEAWPVGVEDCSPGNNRASTSVYVEAPPTPPKEPGKVIPILIS